ncbi:hypothetical protein [Streptomyces sp. NPDC055709]
MAAVWALETTLSLPLRRQYGLPLRGKRLHAAISVGRLRGIVRARYRAGDLEVPVGENSEDSALQRGVR